MKLSQNDLQKLIKNKLRIVSLTPRVKVLLILLGILLGTFIFILAFTFNTIREIPRDSLKGLSEPAITSDSINNFALESDSIVDREELLSYQLFSASNDSHSKNFLKYLKQSDMVEEIGGGKYYLKKDLALDGIISNECQLAHCFQHRMNFYEIPSVLWRGLIGIEDSRFIWHKGVDFRSILRALLQDLRHFRLVQGGSTLTQQLVKNLFYSNEKSIVRKIKEIIVSIYIESEYTKEEILEAYFNEVFWGSLQGVQIKGVYAASLFYFNKRPEYLDQFETAILISMLKGPFYYHPLRHVTRLQERAELTYDKLVELKLFSYDQKDIWNQEQWDQWIGKLKFQDKSQPYSNFWYLTKLSNGPFNDYEKFVFAKKANALLEKVKSDNKNFPNFAIKAVIGKISKDGFKQDRYFQYYSKIERSLEAAINREPHQVGSTLKPVIYSIFRKLGKSLNDYVSLEPITLSLRSGSWTPREAHVVEGQEVTLAEALLQSYNRPVIRLARDIGFKAVEAELVDYLPSLKKPLGEFPSQLLGSLELTMAQLVNIYTKFIYKECLVDEQVGLFSFEDSILGLLSNPNLTTVRRGVNDRLAQMRFFGKTGTSNNGYDNWFVYIQGDTLGIIWVGIDGPREGKFQVYGSTTAFMLFQNYILERGKRFDELDCGIITSGQYFK